MNFYISDNHFLHKNIISYDNRPFNSIDEMTEGMVALWNETVAAGDSVYVLGDFCWSQRCEDWEFILARLKGQIYIIKGNHDRSEILKSLKKNKLIADWSQQEIVKDGKDKVILNHSPMPFFINQHQDNWCHLYGHVHSSYDWNMTMYFQRQIQELYQAKIRMYNVGCMMPYINYVPRKLSEIEVGFDEMVQDSLTFSQNHSWTKEN